MLTQRLGSDTQKDDGFIRDLLRIIRENPGSCDEVWLASEYGFPALEKHSQSAAKLAEVAKKFRDAGIRVSLQISNTIGHGKYMSARDCSGLVYDGSPAEKMVGSGGETADYCFCWNGKHFRQYVIQEVREYCEKIKPYCVWIDDDLRATNHDPVSFGCFCDNCIQTFNEACGSHFTKETLVEEINRGDIRWREKYVDFLRKSLGEFTYAVSRAVHDVSPDSYMGLQYCAHGGYTGYGYAHIFDAMRAATGRNPKSRPGGGAYDDYNPNVFLDKARFISFQNSMLPDYVTECRPEIENLPDVVYGKTIAGTCFETSLYLACGNNAMSYAMLMNDYEPMEWHSEMLAAFARHRPYWQRLIEYNQTTVQAGLQEYFSAEMWRSPLSHNDPNFAWNDEPYNIGGSLARTAIPIADGRSRDPVYLLNLASVRRLTDPDVQFLLQKPVVTDGAVLQWLSEHGYGDKLGAKAEPVDACQLYEEYLEHPINRGFVGRKWAQGFYIRSGHALRDLDGTTEPFGVFRTVSRNAPKSYPKEYYPYGVANAVVKTACGAKWAVFGHMPWTDVISKEKRDQILHAADYISHNRTPAILESPQKAVLLPRENTEGQTACVSVVNCTVGETGELTLRVRRPVGTNFGFMSPTRRADHLSYKLDGEDYLVEIPAILPWTVGTLFIE